MIDFEEYLGQQIDLRMEVYEEIKDEVYQQGRADAIEECKKIVMAECTTTCEYPFSPNCVECMTNKMEKLKEQGNGE